MIRARTLFPLRNGSLTVAAKPMADALPTLSSRSVSRAACVIAVRLPRSPRPICPSGAAVPWPQLCPLLRSRPILVLLEHRQGEQRLDHAVHFVWVVLHRTLGLEFAASVAPRDSDHHRTKPERNIGCRTHSVSGPEAASSRNPRRINTFTRRASLERPSGNLLAPAVPQVARFQ